ncbi:MAG TPA: NeuD/PglB/VioB family sugar acetyltransferase [Roseiflexaceae bacterium]|nr:NeuD/PglB/VioB family sugar acetyltransferase [Roseiflexaceae bacterium]
MATAVVGLGAGGHARVLIEILQQDPRYELVGLLDRAPELAGERVLGVPVLGDDALLPALRARGVAHFVVGVGSTGDGSARRRVYEHALGLGLRPVSAIHPAAVVSPSAALGPGATLMALAAINAAAQLGEHVIVNTGSIVGHDCRLEAHVHIATGARLAGGVWVGEGAHVGIGAVVRQGIRIGAGALVGAGAVVVKDVRERTTVAGNPARPLATR